MVVAVPTLSPSPGQTVLEAVTPVPKPSLTVERLFATEHLPTPPAVAMQVVRETSDPNVTSGRISKILRQDPVLCARVLKAINSVVYGMREQVTSVERAVLLLGLNAVRGIVLALSLPAMQGSGRHDRTFRDYWQSAVSGAVIARELAVRLKVPTADDDMIVGLLRDIGELLIQQALPTEYAAYTHAREGTPFSRLCQFERKVFGFDHAEVSGELLRRWQLPDSLVQPIRHHHDPAALGDHSPALRERCERLGFVDALTHLDLVAHQPDEVDALLKVAATRYGLGHAELVRFLEGVVPQVEEFTALLNVDAGRSPNYAATLARGSTELFHLTVESGAMPVTATVRTPAGVATTPTPVGGGLREFHSDHLEVFPKGGCALDGYELKRVLGRGAMGVVFEGTDTTLDRPVAVKMMLPELAEHERFRQRFIREARSVAAIRHENVVAIHAVKDNGPFTYLVMEFVEGPSLADRVEEGLPLAPDELIALGIQLAGGLVGTPLYMSPEQASGRPVGPRSDLFSLGAVLYTAATGKPPFDDRTMFGVLKKVCEQQPDTPSRLRPDLPPWFVAALLQLLAKEEDDRYQSADELLSALCNPPVPPPTPAARKGWWPFGRG